MDPLNTEQVREIGQAFSEAAAQAAVRKLVTEHPHFAAPSPKAEIPPGLKWAGICAAGLMTFAVTGMAAWTVTTLNDLQITVARIDERQLHDTTGKRLDVVEERVTKLEEKVK